MRCKALAVLLVVIALALPRLSSVHVHVLRKAAVVTSSASWGRHRRPPLWRKRPCEGRGCIDIAVLDSSGLCVLCNPSPHHPGHIVTLSLDELTFTTAGLPMRKRAPTI